MLLHNDPFGDFDSFFSRLGGRATSGSHTVPLDAYRRGEDVWVHADLPGVAADTVDVSVERNVLTIAAERNWQREDGDRFYLQERSRGAYRRQVHLGEGLDADNIEANFSDGVLTLRIPVAEVAKPKKITIGTSAPAIDVEALTPADAS